MGESRHWMSQYHTVKPGECLSTIARRYGYHDYQIIYRHPENSDFRSKRPDPNIIHPGDRLFIPEPVPGNRRRETGDRHIVTITAAKTTIRIVIANEKGRPLRSRYYELVVGSYKASGVTGGDGLI